ncbi:MAG: hypothetical protein ABH865_01700 [Candidatus Omnitrophota bacterium]
MSGFSSVHRAADTVLDYKEMKALDLKKFLEDAPFPKREIFLHGLHWQPSSDSLPMELKINNAAQTTVGLFFLPLSLALFLLGIPLIFWANEMGFIAIIISLVLMALGAMGIKYSIEQIFKREKLIISHSYVELISTMFRSNKSWKEPLEKYKGVLGYKQRSCTVQGIYMPGVWCIILLHPEHDKSVLLYLHNSEEKDSTFETKLQRFSKLLKKGIIREGA